MTSFFFTLLGWSGRGSQYLAKLNSKFGMKILNAIAGVCLGYGGLNVMLLNDVISLATGKFHWF